MPAGNDVFAPQLVEHYFAPYLPQLKIDRDEFLGLGRQNPRDQNEPFGMTVLAIRLANIANGVSKLHGSVSRKMWQEHLARTARRGDPDHARSPTASTRRSWLSPEMSQLYDRYLGVQWEERPTDHCDLEARRQHPRRRAVAHARTPPRTAGGVRAQPAQAPARAPRRAARRRSPAPTKCSIPEALTIGFARRFATYKRGTLIFRNLERLAAILNNKDRPVQIIFAGKAHPRDHGGKELIAEIIHVCPPAEFRRRMVFIEDYDINVARYLVQGVDVWLNNPRRPLEASGTSGMKVCVNGGLNLSHPRRLVGARATPATTAGPSAPARNTPT